MKAIINIWNEKEYKMKDAVFDSYKVRTQEQQEKAVEESMVPTSLNKDVKDER